VLEFNQLKDLLFVLRAFVRATVFGWMLFVLPPSPSKVGILFACLLSVAALYRLDVQVHSLDIPRTQLAARNREMAITFPGEMINFRRSGMRQTLKMLSIRDS